MVADVNRRLADQELSLELTGEAKEMVIDNGYDPVYGARPLKRYLQKYVETLAAKRILRGDVHEREDVYKRQSLDSANNKCYSLNRTRSESQ